VQTIGANEALWVELPLHGRDAAAGDRLAAGGARGKDEVRLWRQWLI